MKALALLSLVIGLSACGGAPGSAPAPLAPSPNECTNRNFNVAAQPDGSYDDGNGCMTTVLNHQVISNITVPVCSGWC